MKENIITGNEATKVGTPTECRSHCGHTFELDELEEFDNELLCWECYDDITETCSNCGRRIYNGYNYGEENVTLYQSCHDMSYTRCT